MSGERSFRVGLSGDFLKPDGTLGYGDIGLDLLDRAPGVEWSFLPQCGPELTPEAVRGYDALLLLAPRVTEATLAGADRLAIVARFGAGYDNVDLDACSRRGILVTITPDGVRRPVAVGALTFVLALSHRLLVKDRLTRAGRWADKLDYQGLGVTGRALGIVGLGNTGQELVAISRPLGLRYLAYDPYARPERAAELGVALVDLPTLLREADYVVVMCALTPETHHLIGAEQLALMKPSAYLVNVARGPIVDQAALTEALRAGRIQGAGLDVFDPEPPDPRDPILGLDNVILAPHAIVWTDECFRGNGESACRAILDVAAGRLPRYVVNRTVLDNPRVRALRRAED